MQSDFDSIKSQYDEVLDLCDEINSLLTNKLLEPSSLGINSFSERSVLSEGRRGVFSE